MKLHKCLKHAFNMVIHSKVRSWLTILGIVIGVAAVIAIVSIGEGMKSEIQSQLGGLGADLVSITAGASRGGGFRGGDFGEFNNNAKSNSANLTRIDVQALKGIPDFALIDTQIRGNAKVYYLGQSGSISVTGVDESTWAQITTSTLADGRMLGPADQNVVVIGGRLANSYFEHPIGINKLITIEGVAFRVIGIMDDNSNSIYMPLDFAYDIIADKERNVFDTIVIKLKDANTLNATLDKINTKLMMVRHVTTKNKDFTVTSQAQMAATRQQMMTSMTAFLTALAAVSLIVGAVGIANTMFTSVLEKTKEIGIMKAIGARNKDILTIFLMNAGLIGLIGGIIGIVFGILLSWFMPYLLSGMPMSRGLQTLVNYQIILIALGLSIGIGMLSGAIPAWQGSKLKPVDALRYE